MTHIAQSLKYDAKPEDGFKRKFEQFFLWASPLGLIADLISIWGLVNFRNQTVAQQIQSPSPIYAEPKVFGFLVISDAIVLTGLVTLFIIVSTIYGSVLLARSQENLWPYIWGSFIVLILSWSYFRLWLGEYGWIWILLAFVLISVITTYLLFNMELVRPDFGLGCVIATLTLVILTIFLIATTGAWNRISNYIDSVSPAATQTINTHGQPTQQPEMVLPTVVTEGIPFQSYVPYELPAENWFPAPSEIGEGLYAGNVGQVTNEKASWGSADSLRLFQSWGRITSYERFYSHQRGCDSPDIKSVYLQIIFFQAPDGSKSFFDWANKDASVKIVDTVGDNAYIYSENRVEDDCPIALVSTTFQRYNVIARARVNSIEGKMGYEAAESISLKIAHLIDERIKSEAK